MIDQLRNLYPIELLCRALNYARSSYYYRRRPRDEDALRLRLRETQGQWPTYGYLTADCAYLIFYRQSMPDMNVAQNRQRILHMSVG